MNTGLEIVSSNDFITDYHQKPRESNLYINRIKFMKVFRSFFGIKNIAFILLLLLLLKKR